MNKNAIGLHKFSRIFSGDDARSSTRPVQIATKKCNQDAQDKSFASTRPVQIATSKCRNFAVMSCPCLHTPRADCNMPRLEITNEESIFASTRPVQIATSERRKTMSMTSLCLHTPRADCNEVQHGRKARLALCLHTPRADCNGFNAQNPQKFLYLCLHTPRADCNGRNAQNCNMHFSERVLSR